MKELPEHTVKLAAILYRSMHVKPAAMAVEVATAGIEFPTMRSALNRSSSGKIPYERMRILAKQNTKSLLMNEK